MKNKSSARNKSKKSKPFHQKFHDEIEKLLKDAGSAIEKSSYTEAGPDIIASAEGDRVLVQCKAMEKENEVFSGLDDLVNSYSKRVEKEDALVAILPLKNYKLTSKYYGGEKKNKLLQEKIVIWCNDDIDYYKEIVRSLGKWSRFSILGDLGRKKSFGKSICVPAFKVEQDGAEFCIFKVAP
jgi:hypothetical protein